MASTHSSKRDLAVGVTTFLGIVGLAVLMLVFGYVPRFVQSTYPLEIRMPQSGGLHADATINLAGIEIGRVESVRFADEGPAHGVVVSARIASRHRIPQNSVVKVNRPLLGGIATANIHPSAPDAGGEIALLPTDGSARLEGRVASMMPELEAPLESFTEITQDFTDLADQWKRVGENLNQLLAARSVESVDAEQAVANLSTLVQRLDARVAEARQVVDGVRDLVGDEEVRKDIRTTVRNAAEVSRAVGDTVRTARETITAARDRMDQLSRRVTKVADDLSGAVGRADELLRRSTEGEGTVAELINDPGLAQNLEDASERLQKVLDEARLLIQKWKAEGLPVQF